jgi:hypothetical protein
MDALAFTFVTAVTGKRDQELSFKSPVLSVKSEPSNLSSSAKRSTPNMKSIFIVLGETGENDSQRSWLVKAFPSEEAAVSFIGKLESTYQSVAGEDEELSQESEEQLVQAMQALDENFDFESETGTAYSITELPFEGFAKPVQKPSRDGQRPFRPQCGPSKGSKGQDRRPRR